NNFQKPINSLEHVLNMAPLYSMPYNCPLGDISSYGTKGEGKTEAIEKVGAAKIFLPSNSPREDWETFAAASAMIAQVLRLMALGETKGLNCDILPDGKIIIKGITTGEKIVCKSGQIFRMMAQNLPQPGHFSMHFQLSGSVDPQQFTGQFLKRSS
ncbi:hypothetical protein CFOL_v3_22423, partial [Cephalotus follicularis]